MKSCVRDRMRLILCNEICEFVCWASARRLPAWHRGKTDLRRFLYSVVSCSIVPMSPKNVIIQFVSDNDNPRGIYIRNPFSILAKRKKKNIWHGSDRTRDGQGKNIMPPLKHGDVWGKPRRAPSCNSVYIGLQNLRKTSFAGWDG